MINSCVIESELLFHIFKNIENSEFKLVIKAKCQLSPVKQTENTNNLRGSYYRQHICNRRTFSPLGAESV